MNDLEVKLQAAQEEIKMLRRKKSSLALARGGDIAKSQRKRASCTRR